MIILQLNPFPVLTTNRLVLRKFEQADAEAMFQLRSDPEVMQYLNRPMAKSIDDVKDLLNRIQRETDENKSVAWCICLKENPGLIGFIGLWRIEPENNRGELGYMLHPKYQKQGLMQEALEAVLHYAFDTMLCHTLMADVHPGNQASIKLLERNQFVREGYLRDSIFFDGRYYDAVIYGRINPRDEIRG